MKWLALRTPEWLAAGGGETGRFCLLRWVREQKGMRMADKRMQSFIDAAEQFAGGEESLLLFLEAAIRAGAGPLMALDADSFGD